MKKILGLDLGVTSIGWALVNEKENPEEESSIIKLGVRVNPLSTDERTNFDKGNSITTTAERTRYRSARRNLQRYKLRKENLIAVLKEHGFIDGNTLLSEQGNFTTFETYRLRAKAAVDEITLAQLARVLLMINKKRGYKSNRKAQSEDEGALIDGMQVAQLLYDKDYTVGQYVYNELLSKGKKHIPDFYRSDLKSEFDMIWNVQAAYYPDLLTQELKDNLTGKTSQQTWAICQKPFGIQGLGRKSRGADVQKENYRWRTEALKQQLGLEELAVVLQEINKQIYKSSGYLGAISDRSKELIINKLTVGQYQMAYLVNNPHASLKNMVFYRQDYLDEFETIWETQSKYHKELTPELKHTIRDIIIFYQRRLKSQKGLVSYCEFEHKQIEVERDGKKHIKTIGYKVAPKSSPLFQEFKIWQRLNDVVVSGCVIKDELSLYEGVNTVFKQGKRFLTQDEKELLFSELQLVRELKKNDAIKLLFKNHTEVDMNFEKLDGNHTMSALFNAYVQIIEISGHELIDWKKAGATKFIENIASIFNELDINTGLLYFDSDLSDSDFDRQPLYMLWHLLYSYEGDNSKTGTESLLKKLQDSFGLDRESAQVLSRVSFKDDYCSLSTKAMRKILPYLKGGNQYDMACAYAGYRHSAKSLTKEELDAKELKEQLSLIPHNSLRNPVVEKILNQMIHVVNAIINQYGKPDEIRIELARELKKSAKERQDAVRAIRNNTDETNRIKQLLQGQTDNGYVSRNDIIRYRLYEELKDNGYRTLYSNTFIPREKIFSKEFDIEHIIPQSKLFDDSFSNKTLELRQENIEKGNFTAYDWVLSKYGEDGAQNYIKRIEALYQQHCISKAKYNKLMMKEVDIPSGFIDRDLRNTQYIAKKAREILEEVVCVVVPTVGSVTDRLREDWQLVNVMRELNFSKYEKQGLTEVLVGRDGQRVYKIKDWTKRNDHRHHAMDALTIAFTKPSYIQYLNNLNARLAHDEIEDGIRAVKPNDKAQVVYAIEKKELCRDSKGKLRFIPPMPLELFRAEVKRQLENILVSIKAKNKVVTRHVNRTKCSGGYNEKVQLTPRGQLHEATVYGKRQIFVVENQRIGSNFSEDVVASVTNKKIREALLTRLHACGGDPKKAFTGKNALSKNPIYLNADHTKVVPERVPVRVTQDVYTIRKPVDPNLNIDKVFDRNIRELLQRRLSQFGGNAQKAFSNLDENPIWLNKEKNIAVKRVAIKALVNPIPVHAKNDSSGCIVYGDDGNAVGNDFVKTGNNHHVAIYEDGDGNYYEHIVSFFEATTRASLGLPIVDREYNKEDGWQLLFTMKQNEYFVFPNEETGFNPQDVELKNPDNYQEVSKNMYRVQKLSSKKYLFRHHLETTVDESKSLMGITYKSVRSLEFATKVVKVRLNHLGEIVDVGEY